MATFKVVFSKVIFPSGEKLNYSLCSEAENAEAAQENSIDLIESMGGIHGEIIKIEKQPSMPLPGTGIVAVN